MADDKTKPSHYQGFSNGAIPWDIAERLNYNRGTALVYIARAGRKQGESALDDLQKAQAYLEREINRIITDGKEVPTQLPLSSPGGFGTPIGGVLGGPNPVAVGTAQTPSREV